MGAYRTGIPSLLQDEQTLSAADAVGQVGGQGVVRASRSASELEMWVEASAVDPLFEGSFILEGRLRGGSAWTEVARLDLTAAALGTPPSAFATLAARRQGRALGEEVRLRYQVIAGDITASVKLVTRS